MIHWFRMHCILFLQTASLLLLSHQVWPQADWNAFDPPPLTIIAPEEQALSNPPFLHWQALSGTDRYTVTLSGAGTTHSWSTTRNFFTPPNRLTPGAYSLRITPEPSAARTSSTHTFVIRPSAAGIEDEWQTLTSATRFRLAFPPPEVEAIRGATGKRVEYRDRLLSKAQEPRPESLTTFSEPQRYAGGKWNYTDWSRNNRTSEAAHDHLLHQTVAFLLTKEERFLTEARTSLLALARWDPTGATGVWENDHGAWHLLHGLSLGYNLLNDRLNEDERRQIAESIRRRGADMYRFLNPFVGKDTSAGRMNDPDNNHPWFCAAALGFAGLALWDEHPEARDWAAFSAQLHHGMFLPRGGASGAWHEGIDYWSYTLYFVLQFADALKAAGGPDLYRHPWLSNTAAFKVYVHPPQGGYVPFGDCKHHAPDAFDKLVMMRFASAYQDPLAWRYVDSIPSEIDGSRLLLALLWDGERSTGGNLDSSLNLPFARHYEDVGWVVSNSAPLDVRQQVILAFRSGPFFGRKFGHAQGDLNSFILTAGGEKLLWDAGYYDSYLSAHHRDYSSQNVAHNTILVDGMGQVVHTAGLDGRITAFEVDGTSMTVQGDASAPLIYGGRVDKFVRTLHYRDKAVLEVTDEIVLREPGQISWLLHSTVPFQYDSGAQSFRLIGRNYTVEGQLETSTAVTAILSEGFPVPPAAGFKVPLDADGKPERQLHLEWKTEEKVQGWTPQVRVRLIRNDARNSSESRQFQLPRHYSN